MLRHTTRNLRAKSNANEVCGFPPGTLLCASTGAGGGFVNAPESIGVWVRRGEGWPESLFPRVDFPKESKTCHYNILEEDGTFYLEEHRLKYGWDIPVTEAQKHGEKGKE